MTQETAAILWLQQQLANLQAQITELKARIKVLEGADDE